MRPASGGPAQNAMPWKRASRPNELVRFSRPSSSTNTSGRRLVHVAENKHVYFVRKKNGM